jgi:hypothetical protein
MSERIHLLVDRDEKERFRRAAARHGVSLSEWLKAAAREKLAQAESANVLDTPDALAAFFAACDQVEAGTEPDWEVHEMVIEQSRAGRITGSRSNPRRGTSR